MAILSKIRDRSMFLILIVGLALFAFVLDPSSIQDFFSASKVNSIGEVNGEEIDREEFARQVEAYKAQNGNNVTQMQSVDAVWNTFIAEKIFAKQLDEAGIVVGEKDIWDAMISLPQIQNAPNFKNAANLFDEEKLKEYIANLKDEADSGNPQAWLNWLSTEKDIKENLERQAYSSLVTAGLGASLEEGKRNYLYQNTGISGQFVYIPYSSIVDSLAIVTDNDIKNYVSKNPNKYKPAASRSLSYVKFDIVPSLADDKAVKENVASFINDREEYSNAVKATVTVPGLKNATDYDEFLNINKSDLSLDNGYKFRAQLPAVVSNEISNANVGDVVGPYKQNGYYKISKVIDVMEMSDSVKSSHIVVSFAGAQGAASLKTKEEAKKEVDSIFNLVKNNKDKFAEVADVLNGTVDKGGDLGWIRKDQAYSPGFDTGLADYMYKNEEGSVGIVETASRFHIISITDQTELQKVTKLATFSRLVEASEETENEIFEKAETMASDLANGQTIEEVGTAKGYSVQAAQNLKELDEIVPGLNDQRQIVQWAFKSETEIGGSKRFDVEVNGKRGYAVVALSSMTTNKEVPLTSTVLAEVRPLLINKKKTELIEAKLSGSTLAEIATSAKVTVRNMSSVNLGSPTLSGVGNEPAVVGAASTIELNKVSDKIQGEKGVFVIKVIERKDPVDIENYDSFRKSIVIGLSGRTNQLYKVLEETSDIKDNRANFF